jgi:glycosyltransferase involved in cell wall biosynthesis
VTKHRLAIVASHPIQYQDPFFRLLAKEEEIDLTVLYCSRHGAKTYRDEDMGTTLRWDVEMLRGYEHRFLRNFGGDPNAGYTRLINPGIVPALIGGKCDAVIFMLGWGSITALLGIAACRLSRTPFFLFGDSSFPPPENTLRGCIRAGLFRFLFALPTGFMTSGKLNADYYLHYGADPKTFFLLPWAVDNERFSEAGRMTIEERSALRAHYDIDSSSIVFLFSGKLVGRKDPMTLLRAYEAMCFRENVVVVFMGDGALREDLERYARDHDLTRGVRFIGFVNQREIPRHYAISDAFVLPSVYEPRGSVINEAMACGLPVIVTDHCGSIGDIVQENKNALIYPSGDARALATHLDTLTTDTALREAMSGWSLAIISDWSYERGVEGVRTMLRWMDQQ